MKTALVLVALYWVLKPKPAPRGDVEIGDVILRSPEDEWRKWPGGGG